MTELQFYEHVLTELNKVEAPSILLEDFNYIASKSVQQYVNKVYNRYDINQQSTDDLRALKTSVKKEIVSDKNITTPDGILYYTDLPTDCLHILNCIVSFNRTGEINPDKPCMEGKWPTDDLAYKSMARRLTSDMYPNIMKNAYFKPSYKTPYYFLNISGVEDYQSIYNMLMTCSTGNNSAESLKLEIRSGSTSRYEPKLAYIDYIRIPKSFSLTYADLESEGDKSRILEFPEYVCYEIINECVKLILENASDPRLQTNIPINQTIGNIVSQNN